jgi:hypothetical protein
MKEKGSTETEILAASNLNYASSASTDGQSTNYCNHHGTYGEPDADQVNIEGKA